MRHPDQVLSRSQILSHVWGYTAEPGTNVINVYVAMLRRKLGINVIDSVRGVGYCMPSHRRRAVAAPERDL
jgi:DNA-binding response OmpR family regulator